MSTAGRILGSIGVVASRSPYVQLYRDALGEVEALSGHLREANERAATLERAVLKLDGHPRDEVRCILCGVDWPVPDNHDPDCIVPALIAKYPDG
jgi:hypothetical protein